MSLCIAMRLLDLVIAQLPKGKDVADNRVSTLSVKKGGMMRDSNSHLSARGRRAALGGWLFARSLSRPSLQWSALLLISPLWYLFPLTSIMPLFISVSVYILLQTSIHGLL